MNFCLQHPRDHLRYIIVVQRVFGGYQIQALNIRAKYSEVIVPDE